MSNERVGKLTIIRDDPTAPAYVITKCECGRERSVKRGELNRQKKKGNSVISCGICSFEDYGKEMIGKTYGHLLVEEFRIQDGTFNKTVEVLCKCECGESEPFWWKAADLRQGRKKACGEPGCQYVRRHNRGTVKSKHGIRISDEENKLRKRWASIHERCYKKDHKSYNDYGALGIGVDWEWYEKNPEGRSNFIKWFKEEVKKEYANNIKDPTVDRIDGNKNYSSSNCRLASKSAQSANQKRRNDAKNNYKHISPNKSRSSDTVVGNKITVGYEHDVYTLYISVDDVPLALDQESLIFVHYVKHQMGLYFTTVSPIDFDLSIASHEETIENAKFEIATPVRKEVNVERYKGHYRYALSAFSKLPGYRSVKFIVDGKTYISKIAYNINILKEFIGNKHAKS